MPNVLLLLLASLGAGIGIALVFVCAPLVRRWYRRFRHARQLRRLAPEPREPVRLTREQASEQAAQLGLHRESAAAKKFITRYVDDLLLAGVSPQDAYREANAVYHESFSGWG